jgi:hypothetical protein
MKVFLDDERTPPEGWTLYKKPWEVIELLKAGKVTEISLDHYLGLDSYVKPNTGLDVAEFIAQGAKDGTLNRLVIYFHTCDEEVQWKMRACMRDAYDAWDDQDKIAGRESPHNFHLRIPGYTPTKP